MMVAVVRHKTEGDKLNVASMKWDRKITQQPDERSGPIPKIEAKIRAMM